MATYADYTFYTGTYLGTAIASSEFSRLALRASAYIDRVTFDRAAAIITANTPAASVTAIQNATCAIAEELQKSEAAGGVDGITSERVGNYSVTMRENSTSAMSLDQKISEAAKLYLRNTGLMFQGFASGEYGGSVDEDE
jgi:hypothetical protein